MPLRAKRRRVRAAIVFGVLLVLAGIAYGIHVVSYLPQLSVGKIVVSGTQDVPEKLVSDYAQSIINDGSYHFLSRSDIFLYPGAVVARDIPLNFPRISQARVSRASLFSTQVDVQVSERQRFALWCEGTQCFDMDSGGVVFAESSATSSGEYIFQGGIATTTNPIGQSFVSTHLPALVALLNQLGQAGFAPLGVTVANETDFSVPLATGYSLKGSFGENPADLVKNLQLVLSSDALLGKTAQLEYVDLRFGDRVYFKLKGEEEASSTPE